MLSNSSPQPPRLLDQLRLAAQHHGHSTPTVEVLAAWVRTFILFHDKQHPSTLGLPHVSRFLEDVVATHPDPLPALAMSRRALSLLYSDVLATELGELPQPRPPKVLDQLRLVLRVRHYSPKTEECYVNWARRFILFDNKRHPRTMGTADVEQFLTHLAVHDRISASSQNQALNALSHHVAPSFFALVRRSRPISGNHRYPTGSRGRSLRLSRSGRVSCWRSRSAAAGCGAIRANAARKPKRRASRASSLRALVAKITSRTQPQGGA